jgi:hypothetical protein
MNTTALPSVCTLWVASIVQAADFNNNNNFIGGMRMECWWWQREAPREMGTKLTWKNSEMPWTRPTRPSLLGQISWSERLGDKAEAEKMRQEANKYLEDKKCEIGNGNFGSSRSSGGNSRSSSSGNKSSRSADTATLLPWWPFLLPWTHLLLHLHFNISKPSLAKHVSLIMLCG